MNKIHTQLMHLRSNVDPLQVPPLDEGGLLVGHELGNLGDVLDQQQLWIEGIGLVCLTDEDGVEACVSIAYTYTMSCQHISKKE
jgi:hypothetical protein